MITTALIALCLVHQAKSTNNATIYNFVATDFENISSAVVIDRTVFLFDKKRGQVFGMTNQKRKFTLPLPQDGQEIRGIRRVDHQLFTIDRQGFARKVNLATGAISPKSAFRLSSFDFYEGVSLPLEFLKGRNPKNSPSERELDKQLDRLGFGHEWNKAVEVQSKFLLYRSCGPFKIFDIRTSRILATGAIPAIDQLCGYGTLTTDGWLMTAGATLYKVSLTGSVTLAGDWSDNSDIMFVDTNPFLTVVGLRGGSAYISYNR